MSRKSIEALRNGHEFVCRANERGACTRRGKGSHVVVIMPKGEVVVPDTTDDLGKGLRCKLVKMFTLIGLASLTVGCLIVAVVGGM